MTKFLNLIKVYWVVITIVILISIITLSLWPLQTLPSVPGSDKTHHFIAYASLMLPVALRRPKYWIWFGFLFVLISGGIELLQPLVNRHKEGFDMLANGTGVLCGILLSEVLRWLFRGHSRSTK
ncbi:VanZ family protein [bacterium]|nr:VanZ family protein [bacterium]